MAILVGNPLTIAYSLRHVLARKTQTFLTAGGIALVVFVFVATLMLAEGLRSTLASTGSPDNVIVTRTGAENEIQSGIKREDAGVVVTQPEIARLVNGAPLETSDVVVLVTLGKRRDGQPSNVTVRGVSPPAWQLRRGVKLIAGRLPAEGTKEVVVGEAIRRKFAGTDIGEAIRLVGMDWIVVGTFAAGNSALASEIWGDADILMAAFRREQFSSMTLRLVEGADFAELKARLENDRRLSVSVEREQEFYERQSKQLGTFIRVIGGFISAIFSLGAIIGAMITMYGAVANRVREIGVLRALGFSHRTVFSAFVKECLVLGACGGVVGVALGSVLMFVTFSTTNFDTFSDIAFGFRITLAIALEGMAFALVMSAVGGALPAFRASRLKIATAMRRE